MSSAALAYDQTAAGPCQGLPQNHEVFGSRNVTPPSIHRPNNGDGDGFMSAEQFRRTIQQSISVALRKRVGPGTGLTVKQLAYTLRIDQQTVWKLLNGYNAPSGPVLMALLTFFDASFANEILEPTGCTVAKITDARAVALRKVAEGMAELRKLG
jgi:hypothetical protein